MAGRIVPGGLGWTETHHELWHAMERAHRHYKRTSAILESITGSHASDVSLPTGTFEYEMAAERQRVSFENYIESRMQFSESLQVGFENYAESRIELCEPLRQANAVATKGTQSGSIEGPSAGCFAPAWSNQHCQAPGSAPSATLRAADPSLTFTVSHCAAQGRPDGEVASQAAGWNHRQKPS